MDGGRREHDDEKARVDGSEPSKTDADVCSVEYRNIIVYLCSDACARLI